MFLFFFSSRRRHTRCLSDWSSDVCSSDLQPRRGLTDRAEADGGRRGDDAAVPRGLGGDGARRGEAEGTGGTGAGRGPDRRGPPAIPGGAGACGGYAFLAASIFSKISSFSGKRYVS